MSLSKLSAPCILADGPDPCLDIKDGRVQEGTKLQIWDCHPQGHPDYNNQKFNIEWLGPEYP